MDSERVVLDISSDEEDGRWESEGFDDVLVVDDFLPARRRKRKLDFTPRKPVKLSSRYYSDDDGDDCMVLDGDPDESASVVGDARDGGNGSDDLFVLKEKGQLACRDFPHSRHLCANFPFSTTPHEKHCKLCHCYVCDALAPCIYWGNGASSTDHCHSTDKEERWKAERRSFKQRSMTSAGSQNFPTFPFSIPLARNHGSSGQLPIPVPSQTTRLIPRRPRSTTSLNNQNTTAQNNPGRSPVQVPTVVPTNSTRRLIPLGPCSIISRNNQNTTAQNTPRPYFLAYRGRWPGQQVAETQQTPCAGDPKTQQPIPRVQVSHKERRDAVSPLAAKQSNLEYTRVRHFQAVPVRTCGTPLQLSVSNYNETLNVASPMQSPAISTEDNELKRMQLLHVLAEVASELGVPEIIDSNTIAKTNSAAVQGSASGQFLAEANASRVDVDQSVMTGAQSTADNDLAKNPQPSTNSPVSASCPCLELLESLGEETMAAASKEALQPDSGMLMYDLESSWSDLAQI